MTMLKLYLDWSINYHTIITTHPTSDYNDNDEIIIAIFRLVDQLSLPIYLTSDYNDNDETIIAIFRLANQLSYNYNYPSDKKLFCCPQLAVSSYLLVGNTQ